MPGQRHELHHKICNLRYGTLGVSSFEFCRSYSGLTDFHNLDIACHTVLDK